MSFGARLKELRKKNNLTQEDLAEKFFVSRQAVTKWETDRSMPDSDNIAKMAEFFGVSIEYLVYGEEKSQKHRNYKPIIIGSLASLIVIASVILGLYFSGCFENRSAEKQVASYVVLDRYLEINDPSMLEQNDLPYLYIEDTNLKKKYFNHDESEESLTFYIPYDKYELLNIYSIYYDFNKGNYYTKLVRNVNLNRESGNSYGYTCGDYYFSVILRDPIEAVEIISYDINLRPLTNDVVSIGSNGLLSSSIETKIDNYSIGKYHIIGAISYTIKINYLSGRTKTIRIINNESVLLYFSNYTSPLVDVSYKVDFIIG